MLQAQQQTWQRREVLSTDWLNVLTQRATVLQDALNRLAEIRETWRRTRDEATASKAPGPILLQIDGVLTAIDAAEAPLRAQRTAVLDLQSSVAPEVARSQATLARFNEAQQRAMGESWRRTARRSGMRRCGLEARTVLPARLREVAASRWGTSSGTPTTLQADAIACRGRPGPRGLADRGAPTGPSVGRIGRGQLAGYRRVRVSVFRDGVIGLLLLSTPYAPIPPTVRALFVVLGLAAAIRLARRWADPRLGPELSLLWGLFAVGTVRETLAGVVPIEQVILVLEMLAGIAVITYSMRVGDSGTCRPRSRRRGGWPPSARAPASSC